MFKRNKKSKDILYAGLKNRVNIVEDTNIKKEKRPHIKRKLVVAVTSLKHGVGCSYVSVAITNYLSNLNNDENVCLLHSGCSYIDKILDERADSIFYPCNLSNIYSNYGYIVYDGGILKDIDTSMLDRSDIKIMLCWHNDEYIRLIAEFIKTRNDIDNWVFLFNSVPEKKHKEVYALMEDYNSFCLPLFDVSSNDKLIKGLFGRIFY